MPTLGTSDSTGWEDMEKQTVERRLDLQGTDGPTSGSHTFEQLFDLEPTGGLDREELAELVAFERTAVLEPSGGGPSGPTFLKVEWENTMAPKPQLAGDAGASVSTDVDGVTGADAYSLDNEDDPDTVDFWMGEIAQPWEDQTNGTGGSSNSLVLEQAIDFRDMFGQGPVLDRHDRIYSHVHERISGAGWDIEEYIHLYWNVTDD